jgi:hypothetical protein
MGWGRELVGRRRFERRPKVSRLATRWFDRMTLGRHLRELWDIRRGLLVCCLVALLAAGWSVGKISLFPPGVKLRTLQIAAASTQLLVDSSKSAALDTTVNTVSLQEMTNRAVLIGNVMASEPLRSYIMRRAQLPTGAVLQISGPVTPAFPRDLTTAAPRSPTDLLKSPNAYRLYITSNPTVPVLDLYAEAPTPAEASQIANGAIQGMRDYLQAEAGQQRIPADQEVILNQLGTAHGGIINPGISIELGLLSFTLMFIAAAGTTLWLARVRAGWRRETKLRKRRLSLDG